MQQPPENHALPTGGGAERRPQPHFHSSFPPGNQIAARLRTGPNIVNVIARSHADEAVKVFVFSPFSSVRVEFLCWFSENETFRFCHF